MTAGNFFNFNEMPWSIFAEERGLEKLCWVRLQSPAQRDQKSKDFSKRSVHDERSQPERYAFFFFSPACLPSSPLFRPDALWIQESPSHLPSDQAKDDLSYQQQPGHPFPQVKGPPPRRHGRRPVHLDRKSVV